jgi:hypothetical protein
MSPSVSQQCLSFLHRAHLLTNRTSPRKPSAKPPSKPTKHNPSQLGDPVSLKAETSNTSPTSQDPGASSSPSSSLKKYIGNIAPAPTESYANEKGRGDGERGGHKTLRQRAMQKLEENPSQLGDPASLKAETAGSEPTNNDRGPAGRAGNAKL